jgi:hypothetical protein
MDEIRSLMNDIENASVNYLSNSPPKLVLVTAWAITLLAHLTVVGVPWARAASDLTLAPNLSFDDDSSPNFPIQGRNIEGRGRPGEPTIIFFGTSNCWNTAREAERLVKLYPQFRNRFHFVIVDLRNVSATQQPLVSRYYHGYIPTITAIGSDGNVIYNRAGETATIRGDTSNLHRLLDSLH